MAPTEARSLLTSDSSGPCLDERTVKVKGSSPAISIVASHAYLRRVSGANDGFVPNSSQYWGETIAEIEADHFEQDGWRLTVTRGSFDALALYAYIVARLGDVPAAAAEVKAQEKASA